MNQRIEGLWWQARIGYNNQNCDPEVLDKFAELIVQECAGLFPNVYVEIETEYGHTPVIAADYIKKHFGVEP